MNRNFQLGEHPDADQFSVFVEGAASPWERERMLAHLAECEACRKAVFVMQPHEETQPAARTPVTELIGQRQQWRQEGKTVVLTNGCYDLLHPGHIRTIEAARSLGDVLVLALNSDAGTRRMKGPTRPITPENERVELALALEAVDAVTLFDDDTPRALIAAVLPDVLVKGADWSHFVAGREEVEAAGGKVVTLPMEPGYSTTNIERLIAAGHNS